MVMVIKYTYLGKEGNNICSFVIDPFFMELGETIRVRITQIKYVQVTESAKGKRINLILQVE